MLDDIGRVVKSDNNVDYLLVSRIYDDVDTYVYLMSVSSPINVLIAQEKESGNSIIELVVVEDEVERKRIYNLFLQKARLGLL